MAQMKFNQKSPPREFKVGKDGKITIKDVGTIELQPDEQITFITNDGKEYDVARKDWGFYSTPSMNGRLRNQGFKTALVRNDNGMHYIMLVEKNKITLFKNYLSQEKNYLIKWLDEL